jgi:hypothetical protein
MAERKEAASEDGLQVQGFRVWVGCAVAIRAYETN